MNQGRASTHCYLFTDILNSSHFCQREEILLPSVPHHHLEPGFYTLSLSYRNNKYKYYHPSTWSTVVPSFIWGGKEFNLLMQSPGHQLEATSDRIMGSANHPSSLKENGKRNPCGSVNYPGCHVNYNAPITHTTNILFVAL